MDYLPMYEFRQCVERYSGNYKIKSFSCWDQFLSMAFAQLTYRGKSSGYSGVPLRAAKQKTLSHGHSRKDLPQHISPRQSDKRDWHIYADFAQTLIRKARQLYANDSFGMELEQRLRTGRHNHRPLSVSLSMGNIRKHKGAVKLHTLLDLIGNIPTIAFITSGKVHESQYPRQTADRSRFPYEQFYIIGAYDHRNLPLLQLHTDTDVPEENTIINNQLNLFN